MKKEGKKYLEELVNSIICIPDAFRINIEGEKGEYIFSAFGNETLNEYFSVSAIYDAIVDLDKKIKISFFKALECDFPESLDGYNPFLKLDNKDVIAMYHIENMIYRVNIFWDLLAQVCNIIFHTKWEVEKINNYKYFQQFSSKDNTIEILKEIKKYINEIDNTDVSPWSGNYLYLKDFRNQMTHRITPNITTISAFGTTLRPPLIYLLHRVTEDYYKVSSFFCQIINDFLKNHENWNPFKVSD